MTGVQTCALPIFSGLKSAVINLAHNETQRGNEIRKADLARSFENRVIDILSKKTMRALNEYDVKNLVVAGGVSANRDRKSVV